MDSIQVSIALFTVTVPKKARLFYLQIYHHLKNVLAYWSSCIEMVVEKKVCDLRTVSFDVPPQEILTKDSVTVAVDAVIYYKVSIANCNGDSTKKLDRFVIVICNMKLSLFLES